MTVHLQIDRAQWQNKVGAGGAACTDNAKQQQLTTHLLKPTARPHVFCRSLRVPYQAV